MRYPLAAMAALAFLAACASPGGAPTQAPDPIQVRAAACAEWSRLEDRIAVKASAGVFDRQDRATIRAVDEAVSPMCTDQGAATFDEATLRRGVDSLSAMLASKESN